MSHVDDAFESGHNFLLQRLIGPSIVFGFIFWRKEHCTDMFRSDDGVEYISTIFSKDRELDAVMGYICTEVSGGVLVSPLCLNNLFF